MDDQLKYDTNRYYAENEEWELLLEKYQEFDDKKLFSLLKATHENLYNELRIRAEEALADQERWG